MRIAESALVIGLSALIAGSMLVDLAGAIQKKSEQVINEIITVDISALQDRISD